MSELSIEALLDRLKEPQSAKSVQDLLSSLRAPESPSILEARRRCALVRWFNEEIYNFLGEDLAEKPSFGALIESPNIERLAPAKWTVAAAERNRLLEGWRSELSTWRGWNTKLGAFFQAREGAENQLSAVYHLAASTSPESVEAPFRRWFSEADRRFDMAHCNALLEMLRMQESWRESAVSGLWREYREYHSARLLFAEDYYKTGSYFQRAGVFKELNSVLERTAEGSAWIFHVHASGGIGKSMFTRWLISRYLVPGRIPCARVDLDDYNLQDIVNFPLRMITRIVEQWSKQPKGGGLSTLLERLAREAGIPGWNRSVMREINLQLQGAGIDSKIVVVLDTLEEATLSAEDWLAKCVNFLRDLRGVLPGLTVVLSGRYDITERSSVLIPGECLSYELTRFTEPEAHQYLQSRSIPPGAIRNAIVARAASDEESDDPSEELVRCNPFKLAMFAELVLNRRSLTEDEVLRFPRADIAYLIERVIKRIESQPLRWIIRYGAIARHLTPEFAQEVLLPPLIRALLGTDSDQPQAGLVEHGDDYRDVWLPDSKAAEELQEKGISLLWDKLSTYARDRGWLSWVNVDDKTELRFHPEVLNPTRDLLRHQEIFKELQEKAAEFFENKAQALSHEQPPRTEASVRCSCEAVFHRFQSIGVEAEQYWIDTLRRAEKSGPETALPVATEIAGREYAEAEQFPLDWVSSHHLLIRSHCEAADLLLQADIADRANWMGFRRHVEHARAIAGKNAYLSARIPPLLQTMYVAGLRDTAEKKEVVSVLKEALFYADEARDRFFLTWQLGKFLVLQGSAHAATYLRSGLQLLGDANRTSTRYIDIYFKLVDLYAFQGIHTAVIEALRAARKSTKRGNNRILVMHREAGYFLKVGDITSADKRLAEIRELSETLPGPSTAINILEARIAIARLDPIAALHALDRSQATTLDARDRARCLDQEGEARALLYQFEPALERWNLASSSYDQARDPVGSARCALLSASLVAKGIGDFRVAETHVLSALSLRGAEDVEIRSELNLLYALIHLRLGRVDRAAELVRELLSQEGIRARVMVFALLFGLESGEEFLKELEDSISEIQPLSLREYLFDWADCCNQGVSVPSEFVTRLMGLLTRPALEASGGTRMLIQRADLYRIFGMREEAKAELDRVTDSGLLVSWRLCSARDRLGLRAGYRALLERFLESEYAATPLCTVVRVGAASEALADNDFDAADKLLKDQPQPPGLPLLWQERLTKIRTQLLVSVRTPFPVNKPPKLKSAVSFSTFAPEPVITERDLPNELRKAASSVETAVDSFFGGSFGGWQGLRAAMYSVLRDKSSLRKPLEFAGGISALPWELAGAYCRTSTKVNPGSLPSSPISAARVLLVLPLVATSELSSDSDSGFAIDSVYRRYGFAPDIVSLEDIPKFGAQVPPVLIHIVAAFREASNGIYLDFSSSEYRAFSFGKAFTEFEISETAFQLDRILAALPVPPFVILDPGLPYNSTEAVRMLLLRNLFAAQLFELGHVRGVLGCGLASSFDRFTITTQLVESLLHKKPIDTLEDLRGEAAVGDGLQQLEYVLPRFCAALWSNNPEDRLFEP